MPKTAKKTEDDHLAETKQAMLDAVLPHVPFDGWSDESLAAALADSGLKPDLVALALPRGALDLALAYHKQGDAQMAARAAKTDLTVMRYSERVPALVRFRLEAATDREIVRRGVTFFAMPAHAGEGAGAIWQTSDLIWNSLGDTSDDLNWYSKRTILSAVYSSTLLFWLGDDSPNHQETWEFLNRRIENVMQFEKFKGSMRKLPFAEAVMRGPGQILNRIHAPSTNDRPDLPGHMPQKS